MGLNYIVGLIEGLLFLVLSIGIIVYAFSLHSYGEWALSPALFPLILGGVLFCFSLILLVKRYRSKFKERQGVSIDWFLALGSVGLSITYALLLPVLHFTLSTLLYLSSFLLILGVRNLWILIGLPIGLTVSIYYIFGVLLKVVLP